MPCPIDRSNYQASLFPPLWTTDFGPVRETFYRISTIFLEHMPSLTIMQMSGCESVKHASLQLPPPPTMDRIDGGCNRWLGDKGQGWIESQFGNQDIDYDLNDYSIHTPSTRLVLRMTVVSDLIIHQRKSANPSLNRYPRKAITGKTRWYREEA